MSLNANYTFVGKGNWSIDGVGGQATSGGIISSIIPDGSRVEAAFLYASTFDSGSVAGVTIARGSSSADITAFDALGVSGPLSLQGYRADITAYVRGVVGDGDAAAFDFEISNISGSGVDGFALVVVYSNPNEDTRTISLLDGFSNPDGDAFELSFAEPVDTDQAGFEAQMSLGIGFGFQGSAQYSTVTVDGRQLTTSAGGSDDGFDANGGLLTIGGIDDSTENPDPNALPNEDRRTDDELYDLAKGNGADPTPFLADGATSISVTTLNPSDDDNIFFAGFNITAVVAVDTDDNDAPVAVADTVSVDEDEIATVFNVLTNDFDPDEDDGFSIVSVDTTGLVGELNAEEDGFFNYSPNGAFDDLDEGETATTSFTYTISDGELTSTATVTIVINGSDDDGPPPAGCPTVDRPGTQDGSASANETLTGPAYHNTFYFDNAAGSTGDDRIANFAKDDALVVTEQLRDSNGDGIIGFGGNAVLDLGGGDTVRVDGVRALRFLGEACEGNFVYADASVRRTGWQEGFVLSDDDQTGDATDARGDVFFFDTALDFDLGDDDIAAFGARDVLVTTTSLFDSDVNDVVGFGGNRRLDFSGGTGGPADPGLPGEGGSVGMTDVGGAEITSLEYDGSITRGGVTYYVYSLVGSDAGVADLGFASAASSSAATPLL